jgi:hypothetical protein
VEVVECTDREHHGKSYVLDFSVRRMQDGPPKVAIIVDADCQVQLGTVAGWHVLVSKYRAWCRPWTWT